MRGILEQVGKHAQHANYFCPSVAMHAWGDGIEYDKGHKTYNKDTEQLQIVIAYEAPDTYLRQFALLVLLYQSVAT